MKINENIFEKLLKELFEGEGEMDMTAAAMEEVGSSILHKLDELIEVFREINKREEEEVKMECPFCGAEVVAIMDDETGKWYDECLYCGTKTPAHFHSKNEAIDFWNEWPCRCTKCCEECDEKED